MRAAINEKKIAFILCANDPVETEECIFYINRLAIPEGYEAELFVIEDAHSMTSGYNQAMQASDAKYKLYLHQDVFLIEREMLQRMLEIFDSDPDIGMMGCVGTEHLREDAFAVTGWNLGILNTNGASYQRMYPQEKKPYYEAQALDGLLLMTSQDIPFREELFDAWDFYDISQCCEMRRNGKKVVVPYMQKSWYFHDNHCSRLTDYEKYRKIFLKQYQSDFAKTNRETGKADQEKSLQYNKLKLQARKLVEQQLDEGNIDEVCAMFFDLENCGHLSLLEYETAAQIRIVEQKYHAKVQLWKDANERYENMEALRRLKFLVKRVEFDAAQEKDMLKLRNQFSKYAVMIAAEKYCKDSEKVIGKTV